MVFIARKFFRYAEKLALGLALEVSAFPKPGNIHRFRDFEDTIYEDFIVAALVSVEPLYRGIKRGFKYGYNLNKLNIIYGDIVFETVKMSKTVSGGGNTCLGSILLLSPISIAVGKNLFSKVDIMNMLKDACNLFKEYSTTLDAVYFYKAVRIAKPSYIKKTDITGDFPSVWSENYRQELINKNIRLWDVINYSSSYDIVAKEIVECYPRTYKLSQYISKRLQYHGIWNRAIVEAYLNQLSRELDTLVIRKNGIDSANKIRKKAEEILSTCEDSWLKCFDIVKKFDEELALARINPGSTADIIATAISIYAVSRNQNILRRS